jgi:molybdenum cofactor cytidylyltransferase
MAERAGPVAGVVLAAGSSRRMGTNKLLLTIGGESVLRRAVRRAVEAGLAPVIAVLGHDSDRAAAQLAGLPCHAVLNPDHERGMNGSLRAGVAAVPPEAIAAVVLLADMPLVTSDMIAELVRRYRAGAAPLLLSTYGEVLAPPMLYDRTLFGELGEFLDGDGCGKRVAKRHRAEALEVAWPPAALADLDFPDDVRRVERGGA